MHDKATCYIHSDNSNPVPRNQVTHRSVGRALGR